MCWWQLWDVGDRFRMLVTDLIHCENHQHKEKVANIMFLPATSEISHHHKVTNITVTRLRPIISLCLMVLMLSWFEIDFESCLEMSFIDPLKICPYHDSFIRKVIHFILVTRFIMIIFQCINFIQCWRIWKVKFSSTDCESDIWNIKILRRWTHRKLSYFLDIFD